MASPRQRASHLAVAGALALAGCGDGTPGATSADPPRVVDTAQVEHEISRQLSSPGAEVPEVKCPEDPQAAAGETFTCSVQWSAGASGKVKVTQQSATQMTYEPVSGSFRVPAKTVEASVERALADDGLPDAQASCPDPVHVELGTTVTCTLHRADGTAGGTVSFTFSDASGSVDPESVQAS